MDLTKDFEAFDQWMAAEDTWEREQALAIVGDPEDLPAHVVLHRAGWEPPPTVGPLIAVGIEAACNGQADLCTGCGELRYRADMRWLVDVYQCRGCTGGAGSPALSIDWGSSQTMRG